jgi:serine protease inhibitor
LVNAVLVKVTRDKVKEEFLKEMTKAGSIGKESINSMYHVEFNDKEATERINSWTKNITKGMIKDILKPDQVNRDTALVLINLLYFNGQSAIFFFLILYLMCQLKHRYPFCKCHLLIYKLR